MAALPVLYKRIGLNSSFDGMSKSIFFPESPTIQSSIRAFRTGVKPCCCLLWLRLKMNGSPPGFASAKPQEFVRSSVRKAGY